MRPLVLVTMVALAIGAAMATAPRASAQGMERDAQARVLFERGREAWDQERFERAAELWEQAFQLSGRADLLVNIGNARLRMGDRGAAASAFRHYLAIADDDAPERAIVEADLAELAVEATVAVAPTGTDAVAGQGAARPSSGRGPFDGLVGTWIAGGTTLAVTAVGAGLLADGSSRPDAAGSTEAGNALLGTAALAAVATVVLFFVEGELVRPPGGTQATRGEIVGVRF